MKAPFLAIWSASSTAQRRVRRQVRSSQAVSSASTDRAVRYKRQAIRMGQTRSRRTVRGIHPPLNEKKTRRTTKQQTRSIAQSVPIPKILQAVQCTTTNGVFSRDRVGPVGNPSVREEVFPAPGASSHSLCLPEFRSQVLFPPQRVGLTKNGSGVCTRLRSEQRSRWQVIGRARHPHAFPTESMTDQKELYVTWVTT